MYFRVSLLGGLLLLAALVLPLEAYSASAEEELAATIRAFYAKSSSGDWRGLEALPGVIWAPLPPTMLQNCLPDGGCFARLGKATIGGRNLTVVASGSRGSINSVYFRNAAAPFGEAGVLAAVRGLNMTADLARCTLPGTAGGTNWYRLRSAKTNAGTLSIQTSCGGRPCEAFVLTLGEELPALQPAQLKLYSEQCSVAPGERKAVSASLPHEALGQTIAGLVPLDSGAALPDWASLTGGVGAIHWGASVPQKMDLSYKPDPNPFALPGNLALAGRKFNVLVSGSMTRPSTIYIDEEGMHPRGENLLAVLYARGLAIQLVRCGPIYTESTNNWYSIKSAKTHPVMIRQSIRYDGSRVQDSYELRLDNTLPKRDSRDRDPGVGGCK